MSEFCELSVDFRKISVCERVPLGTCVGETQRTGPEGYPRSRRYYPQITQITQISVLGGGSVWRLEGAFLGSWCLSFVGYPSIFGRFRSARESRLALVWAKHSELGQRDTSDQDVNIRRLHRLRRFRLNLRSTRHITITSIISVILYGPTDLSDHWCGYGST